MIAKPQPLLRRYRPQLQRLVATAIGLGLAHPSWQGPSDFVMRRDKRTYGVSGRAQCWGIYLTVGPYVSDAAILQVIAHELAHLLPWNTDDSHGEIFRTTLRALVKANWPGILPWIEGDQYDDVNDCYAEDQRIEDALASHLALQKFATPVALLEVAHG